MSRPVGSTLALVVGLWAAGARVHAAEPVPADAKELDDLQKDIQRFSDAVREYRVAAKGIVKREYAEKARAIKGKYEAPIAANEKQEKDRRKEAIAVFEAFLKKYPNDKRFTPDAMFRLGELYYELAAEEHLTATEAYQKALDSDNPPSGAAPTPDFTRTIDLYKRLLTEFPNYRMLDRTYYILGYCLTEMQQPGPAKMAFLALTCSNKYRALDTATPLPPSPTSGPKSVIEDIYKECQPVDKTSKFLAESWTRIGEIHFDAIPTETAGAISAFNRVLEFKDSGYYDRGLYKLAWSYYRDNRYADAVKYFDDLVKWSDARKASGEKAESDLRPESVLYLGISFAEKDWDGDQIDDPETGLQRAETFYKGRENEPHVREVFKILGDIYFDRTNYAEGIAVYKGLLAKWPYSPDAPKVQNQIVRAYEKDRNLVQAAKERELLGKNYNNKSKWWSQNQGNPEALAVAQEMAENALLVAATNVHAQAQACKEKWNANKADLRKLDECRALYKTAADLYEKYLAAYPNSKRTYEFSYEYAEALYYSDQLPAAVSAYKAVRDSSLDNKYQEEAARQVIKIWEVMIDKAKAERRLVEPPLPDEKNTKPPIQPIAMPDLLQKYMAELDWYVENMKNERAPDMKYQTAILTLEHRMWPEARKRLQDVADLYCASKPEVGSKAYDALLKTYLIDYNVDGEEAKDCALGQLLTVSENFSESACGKAPSGKTFLDRMADLRSSVKTKVAAERLKLIMENEEKGTNKVIPQCSSGPSGVDLVMGTKTASSGKPGEAAKPGAGAKIKYEFDEGVALDLIDMVNGNPKGPDAPINLNNACVVYEKLFKFGEATRCYERLYKDYPTSGQANDALWNAARNHYKFFEFDKAVGQYLTVATDPRFKSYEHQKEALATAAMLMDNDQQYARAADLYKKYAAEIADKPSDSAQSYYKACLAYEKNKDTGKESQCLKETIKKYDKQQPAGDYVVKSYLKLATIAEQGRDKNATLAAYKRVRDEFVARRLPAATEAAGYAAKAEFLLTEERFKVFQDKKLVFSNPKTIEKVFNAFLGEVTTLVDEYKKVWDYKDATWTLASMLRMGDLYYELAQKLIKSADAPPDDVKKLEKQSCKLTPDDCGMVLQQYKDAIYQFVGQIEDKAKGNWKATLERAAALNVTNDYTKKARENLSKYLPDEFPFIKDERIQLEWPQ